MQSNVDGRGAPLLDNIAVLLQGAGPLLLLEDAATNELLDLSDGRVVVAPGVATLRVCGLGFSGTSTASCQRLRSKGLPPCVHGAGLGKRKSYNVSHNNTRAESGPSRLDHEILDL